MHKPRSSGAGEVSKGRDQRPGGYPGQLPPLGPPGSPALRRPRPPPSRHSPLPPLLGPPPSPLLLPPPLRPCPVRLPGLLSGSSGTLGSNRCVSAPLALSFSGLCVSVSLLISAPLSVSVFLGLSSVSVFPRSPSRPCPPFAGRLVARGACRPRAGRDEWRLHELRERGAGGGARLQLPAAGGRGGCSLLLRLPRPQVLLRRPAQLLPLRAQLHVVAQVPALALTPPRTPLQS